MVSSTATDTMNLIATSTRPQEPVGGSHKPQTQRVKGVSVGRDSEEAAIVTGLGLGTMDQMTGGISLTNPVSSQNDNNSEDVEVHHTPVISQNPNVTCQAASEVATDPETPNTKSIGPPEPGGATHKPQKVPCKLVGGCMRGKT
ncbi:hypothetical protein PAXRUDRAFT_158376 [Paxillus rubicundulus Ve08.2h10]|uniref:Uncharacterized protein n=1 Tax=Paxillus rubicundulus Ve08.2h10 TaxID=930991 RepID=A0A0D0D9R3_9AGAM|nr:hypothetical protein PAXRUDRAFT_158376 [Paxillus rubicundulus Ve08.2h10]